MLLAGFAVLAGAAVALEVAARLGTAGLARLGGVADAVVGHRMGRAAALAAWLWLGWHLFVR